MIRFVALGLLLLPSSHAFLASSTSRSKWKAVKDNDCRTTVALPSSSDDDWSNQHRRQFLALVASSVTAVVVATPAAHAGIDPSVLKALPVEGDVSGGTTRLRQVQAINQPESDNVERPWEDLPSGVLYREYRLGKGEAGTF